MKLRAYGQTDIGLVREQNEDRLLVDLDKAVFAVADGVGGMAGGEVASATAIASMREWLASRPSLVPDQLVDLVKHAHLAVRAAGRSYGKYGIATTLTAAHFFEDRLHLTHVGDSFALLVRDGRCRALTVEHNVETERGDAESLAPYPPRYRYALTRVLGQLEPLVADSLEVQIKAGDWIILATDGLTDLVDLDEMPGLCGGEPAEAGAKLIQSALRRGGHDNITVVAVRVLESPASPIRNDSKGP